ncbi:MAG: hypothetical protein JRI23_11190, partial [Deltaproteobacteria bacterium]|jgi:hypothetical protein|nr:hypothetical protein [Deltaproteobacteria bacterium]MBW2532259.1 hypothetical protein [Deltaproteobacteria bacterium]
VVETQLAAGEPPAVVAALARLRREGLSRHDAVHAIGWLAMEHMKRAFGEQRPVDAAAYAVALEGLTRASWMEAAGVFDGGKPLSARRRSD